MKRLNCLFIHPGQFGYRAGYFHYCKYLIQYGYKVTFVCIDEGYEKVSMDKVKIVYIASTNAIKSRLDLFLEIKRIQKTESFDVALCCYFRGCSIFSLLFIETEAILDIRTGDLASSRIVRSFFNKLIKFESRLFSKIMILSKSLAKTLQLKQGRYTVVPLGAEAISKTKKDFENLNILYVGTFVKRNIEITIDAVALFNNLRPDESLSYDIVGFGSEQEERKIIDRIKSQKMEKFVKFHGRKNYIELVTLMSTANIGLSFIPITEYFDIQPPTKTFEYILSGLCCIGTSTYENRRLINDKNGILCQDNSESLCNAILTYVNRRSSYDENIIRSTLIDYRWDNIVKNKLIPLLSH